ncbi:MAG: nucleotidyltransferase domain-containing protein [Candidatus Hydrothermarchaeota archaeon]
MKKIPDLYLNLILAYCNEIKMHFNERLWSICLFGSVARGNPDATSDIDILIIAEDLDEDVGKRIRETNYIHEKLKNTKEYRELKSSGRCGLISDLFLTPEEAKRIPPILLDVLTDGIIFYDKDGFLKRVLDTLDKKLKALGSKKIFTKKGSYYWILKPDIQVGETIDI